MDEHTWKEATGKLSVLDTKLNYNMTFHNGVKQIGVLDFNGPEMTFTGDADESAKMFFDFIARSFKARLEQERVDERETCERAAAQAAREAIVFAMDAEREACAKVCHDASVPVSGELQSDAQWLALCLATAIRARSNT